MWAQILSLFFPTILGGITKINDPTNQSRARSAGEVFCQAFFQKSGKG
jgi:hypothetical protein